MTFTDYIEGEAEPLPETALEELFRHAKAHRYLVGSDVLMDEGGFHFGPVWFYVNDQDANLFDIIFPEDEIEFRGIGIVTCKLLILKTYDKSIRE